MGVASNGDYMPVNQEVPYGMFACQPPTGVFGCMGNGDIWSVWIDYDGEYLNVALADSSTKRPSDLFKYRVDLASILGGQPAYVGFTGATGNRFELHQVSSWIFVPDPQE